MKHFNKTKLSYLTILFMALAGWPLWGAESDLPSDVQKKQSRNKSALKSHEMIAIEISPQRELSMEREIDEKGEIVFPYLQNIKVAGLAPKELSEKLTKELSAKFLKNPSVTVRRLGRIDAALRGEGLGSTSGEGLSKPVVIFGQVKNPAPFYLRRNEVLLSEVIAASNGFTAEAETGKIKVIRNKKGQQEVEMVNMQDIFSGKILDVALEGGDIVMVPAQPLSINVVGEVEKPGLIPNDQLINEKMNLMQVISLAGGFKKSAALWRVRVIRVVDGKEHSQRVNVKKILKGKRKDIALELGDLIVVPESIL